MPAKAGIQDSPVRLSKRLLDSRLRGNDKGATKNSLTLELVRRHFFDLIFDNPLETV